jgi:hypothetical protein
MGLRLLFMFGRCSLHTYVLCPFPTNNKNLENKAPLVSLPKRKTRSCTISLALPTCVHAPYSYSLGSIFKLPKSVSTGITLEYKSEVSLQVQMDVLCE